MSPTWRPYLSLQFGLPKKCLDSLSCSSMIAYNTFTPCNPSSVSSSPPSTPFKRIRHKCRVSLSISTQHSSVSESTIRISVILYGCAKIFTSSVVCMCSRSVCARCNTRHCLCRQGMRQQRPAALRRNRRYMAFPCFRASVTPS